MRKMTRLAIHTHIHTCYRKSFHSHSGFYARQPCHFSSQNSTFISFSLSFTHSLWLTFSLFLALTLSLSFVLPYTFSLDLLSHFSSSSFSLIYNYVPLFDRSISVLVVPLALFALPTMQSKFYSNILAKNEAKSKASVCFSLLPAQI